MGSKPFFYRRTSMDKQRAGLIKLLNTSTPDRNGMFLVSEYRLKTMLGLMNHLIAREAQIVKLSDSADFCMGVGRIPGMDTDILEHLAESIKSVGRSKT